MQQGMLARDLIAILQSTWQYYHPLPGTYNGPFHLTKMGQYNYKTIDGCLYVFQAVQY